MVLRQLKRTLAGLVVAGSIALAPATANAFDEKDLGRHAPAHMQAIFDSKDGARAAVLGFNVAFGCLKSGIGSYVHDKGFWQGCAKGALAGAVMYAGEHIATYNKYPMVGAVAKFVHDAGGSASDCVMRGEPMFCMYQTEIGPVTFTFRDSIVPDLSFTLTPVIGIVANFAQGQEFDFEQSLYNLTPVFRKPLETVEIGGQLAFMPGYTRGNVISYTGLSGFSEGINNLTMSHEFNHTLFWSKFRFANDLLFWLPQMDKVGRWWNVGQDLGTNLFWAPMYIDSRTYYYLLPELEAYSMQRE